MARYNPNLVDEGLHVAPQIIEKVISTPPKDARTDADDVDFTVTSDEDVAPTKQATKRPRISARNAELTAYVQDNRTAANMALFEAKKAAQKERDEDKSVMYKSMIKEQAEAALNLQAITAKAGRVDKFIDTFLNQGASPSTAMRKAREAVVTPVKKQPE